jgi:hypothetical protein
MTSWQFVMRKRGAWELTIILAGIVCLAIAAWPGLLAHHASWQAALIALGLGLSISGELLSWKRTKGLEAELHAVQPRSLSDQQRANLISTLAGGHKGSVGFCSRLMDSESADFADQLSSTFAEAGWPLAPTINTSLNDVAGYVSMFVTGDNMEPRVQFIRQALNSVGVECRPEAIAENSIGGKREPSTVYIVVGRKS